MSGLDTAVTDFRRFVEIAFGNIVWVSILVLSFGIIQMARLGIRTQDYAILLFGGLVTLVAGTFLYVVNVRRIDNPNIASRPGSIVRGFLIGSSETIIFFFGIYLLLIRGFYSLYTLSNRFGVLRLISGLGFILLALILLNGVRKLRRVDGFLESLDSTLAARQTREGLDD